MLKITNWSRYQSYKDRRPPWIRFHRSVLDDFKFQSMTADSRAILPMLWLLACEYSDPKAGIVTASLQEISFRLRQDERKIRKVIKELEECDFIECIKSVTEPLQDSNQTVSPETETETETEYSAKDKMFDEFWEEYPRKIDKKKSYKLFTRLKLENGLFYKIMSALRNQKKDPQWQTIKFIPHPTTWINNERWDYTETNNDEIERQRELEMLK